MRSHRLAVMCLILAGCAAESPSATDGALSPSTGEPPGPETPGAPTGPGVLTPPPRQNNLPPGSATPGPVAASPAGGGSTPTPGPQATATPTSGATPGPTATPTATPTSGGTPTPKPSATPTPAPSKTPATGSTVASFSGTGTGRTTSFTLSAGYYAFQHRHIGSGGYKAWLLNDRNRKLFTIANTIGDYDHVGIIYINTGGTYSIEIEDADTWSITIRPDDGP